jgi:hypothetical protein
MQAMNCYQMSQYTAVDIPHSLATSPMDLMSSMHLMISATVKIVEPISESKNDEFKNQYPDWKYFVAENDNMSDRIMYLPHLRSAEFPSSQTFNIKLSLNTTQPNIMKIVPRMQIGKLMDVNFVYAFPSSESDAAPEPEGITPLK